MSFNISSLESRYLDYCKRHEVLPNSVVLSWFNQAQIQKAIYHKCALVVLLDQLKDADFFPLIDIFLEIDSSEVDAVDILHQSPCFLNQENILSLIRAIKLRLQVVDLLDISFREDIIWDLFQGGLHCEVLNIRSNAIEKLNMVGKFMQLHTLNLDFCTSLTSLQKDCFGSMPKLMSLSMCGTSISNLWTTTTALSKLPSLVELRFQNCICCKDTGVCTALSREISKLYFQHRNVSGDLSKYIPTDQQAISHNKAFKNSISAGNAFTISKFPSLRQNSLDNSILKLSGALCTSNEHAKFQFEDCFGKLHVHDKDVAPFPPEWDLSYASIISKMYMPCNPSSICFEEHYREFMIASLPNLTVLDNLPIRKLDRDMAKVVFSKHYEYLPYKRQHRDSVTSVLHMRETGTSSVNHKKSLRTKNSFSLGKGKYFYSRSISAAILGSSAWPLCSPLSDIGYITKEEGEALRPRQFEYHPSDPSLMVFGTLDGEVVVINYENRNIVGYIPSFGETCSVLGLCWLKKYPSKLLAGSDNGSLKLYDINHMLPRVADRYCNSSNVIFDTFEHLTSLHVNSSDDQFLTSGYSKKVAVYDICTGKRLELFTDMHREPINVTKFAHHSPSLFVTSSFDHDVKMWDLRQKPVRPCFTASSSRGNVMVVFSPDDQYLLVSAVDNEVKQLLAVDGRLHTDFGIVSTGSTHNYTRSYYINGGDYMISGSSDEPVIRVCCTQTGRRLKDIFLEGKGARSSMLVQSLRGDPFRHFHMAVLAASGRPSSKWELIKMNLLGSSHYTKECCCTGCDFCPSYSLGG